MSKNIDESLRKIVKGSTVIFVGTIVSLFLGFLSRIIMIRFTTQNEYGIYSLTFTIITICTTISTLGLQDGTARYVAYFRGKNETKNVQDIIYSSIISTLMASILITSLVFTVADYIAVDIFHSQEVSYILRIMAISIPFTVLINIIIAIFRGFDKVTTKIYFNNILQPIVYLFLLGVVVYFNPSFIKMITVYLISVLSTFIMIIIYFVKENPILVNWKNVNINHNTKTLLRNSIPLLGVSILIMIMSWTDTLMLGYFKTPEIVASYNAVYPLATLLSTGINSVGFLYLPIISNLYSKNQIKDIRKISESSTKWNFIATIPVFALLFMYPEFIINVLYGSRYSGAGNVLQILALGYIMNSLFGLNYYTLLSAGKSRLLMNCSIISAIMNIILNLILIPPYGMLGAAIASAVSFTFIEIYMTIKLYQFLRVHLFTKMYIKFVLTTVLLIIAFYTFRTLIAQTVWTIWKFYSIFLVTYILSIPLTKSLDEDDFKLLEKIKKKLESIF
ncbi:flippase [Methanosarcina vacuolata]|uniref:Uncharacterized protein n=1 Tax=Methanosarcina vacuolata Z-761 TaxID=1434123 RepID=A0A0E3Q3B0_9EURY|nr:flippase [Methanosarcina vacuolata]AKB43094.1 hypothetical protein MSVAZ_0825 [Methanosarcina vacuolata Z-761]